MVRLVENKREELRGRLTLWKNVVRFVRKKYEPHFDLTSKSWWLKNREDIIEIVRKLENKEDNTRELLRELFNRKIWAGNIGLLQKFLIEAPNEDIQKLLEIVVDVKNSSEFKEEWVNKVYELLKNRYPQQVEKFRALKGHLFNIFGELYGKLHIETDPIMNACSKDFLRSYFESSNYNEFKEAFKELKKEYLKVVGKLSENGFPINAEIDQMFNFFDKVKVWQMAPGEDGELMDMVRENREIYIGWGNVGSLQQYQNKNELKEKIRELYPENDPGTVAGMLWNFYKDMKRGDIVVLKKGNSKIVFGICKVIGEYEFRENTKGDYYHLRQVEFLWLPEKPVEISNLPSNFVQRTLARLDWDKFEKVLENVLDNEPEEFKKITQLLERKSQIILYGPPGTGKTWLARKYVIEKTGEDKPGNRWEFITFHHSYGYEEFIEGFRPRSYENKIWYMIEDGIFKKLSLRALVRGLLGLENTLMDKNKLQRLYELLTKKELLSRQEYNEYIQLKKYLWKLVERLPKDDLEKLTPKFYLIIDEINRGNISKILGELITLLEKDKRLGGDYPLIVTLPYSGEHFAVPPNLYIIGTMNTADRSIALLDVALRRRFAFLEIEPKPEKLKDENNIEGINLEELLEKLNIKIEAIKDRDHRIGHSYFMKVKDLEKLHLVWYYEIVPLLMEYFYNDWEALAWLLGDKFIENKLNKGNKKLKFKKPSEIEGQVEPNSPYGIKFYNVKDEQEKKEFIKALEWIIESVKEEQSGS
ncbi:hypothetical protein DRN38_02475 [Thermococci archaeon]|nr:MAG: hypothetical protein DRN38_02475 [Thermococci archaeon]